MLEMLLGRYPYPGRQLLQAALADHGLGGAQRARGHLLRRAGRICGHLPRQEPGPPPQRQRPPQAPLAAKAPDGRHAAVGVAREDEPRLTHDDARVAAHTPAMWAL